MRSWWSRPAGPRTTEGPRRYHPRPRPPPPGSRARGSVPAGPAEEADIQRGCGDAPEEGSIFLSETQSLSRLISPSAFSLPSPLTSPHLYHRLLAGLVRLCDQVQRPLKLDDARLVQRLSDHLPGSRAVVSTSVPQCISVSAKERLSDHLPGAHQ